MSHTPGLTCGLVLLSASILVACSADVRIGVSLGLFLIGLILAGKYLICD
jgi:hypothetical protein